MCFDYLLLGHLLGDFTFQTDTIAENKAKNWKWNLYHAFIVTICMLVFAIPFGTLIMGLVLINGVLHFIIDFYKSKLPCRSPLHSLFCFVADQSLHLLIIWLISTFYKGEPFYFPVVKELPGLLITLVLVTSASSILIQYILRLMFPSSKESFFIIGNEKVAGIITRLLIFSSLYSSLYFGKPLLLIILVILAAKTVYYYRYWHPLITPAYFYTGLLMDFLIPGAAFIINYL